MSSNGCAKTCAGVHCTGVLLRGTRGCTGLGSVTHCMTRTGFFHTCRCFSLLRLFKSTVVIAGPISVSTTRVGTTHGSHSRMTSLVVESLRRTVPSLPERDRVSATSGKHISGNTTRTFLSHITLCRKA